MKGKQIALIIIILVFGLLCIGWAGLTICHIDVIKEARLILTIDKYADSINFNHKTIELGVNQKSDLDVSMSPENAISKYTLKSSAPGVVKIEGKKAVGISEGDCIVTATTDNGHKSSVVVNVVEAPMAVNIPEKVSTCTGEKFNLKPDDYKNYPDDFFTYTSSDKSVATVDSAGNVNVLKEGKAKITCETYNHITGTCTVESLKKATAVAFDLDSVSVNLKSKIQLSWHFKTGEGAADISFTSSNPKVATVTKDGVVSGVTKGQVTVTIKVSDTVKATCSVTVKDPTEGIRTNLNPNKPMVALTFDDGPKKSNTTSILNTLKKYNAKATFFVVGYRIASEADTLKRAYKEGNEIGSHSWDHKYANHLTASQQLAEITKTNKAIQSVIGTTPTVFRCPGGINCDVYKKQANMPLIRWSIDTLDWETKSSTATYKKITSIFKKGQNLDGDIVLMHDLQNSTPAAVKKICKYLNKKGYQMVTVSELAYYRGVSMQNGKSYLDFYPDSTDTTD